MLGVLLLVVILLVFSFILLSDRISHYIMDKPSYYQIQKFCDYFAQPLIKQYSGSVALLFGLWNLFGPNFGSTLGGVPIIGALIPSLVLCLDAFILNPDLMHWMPILHLKETITEHVNKLTPIAGWITLGATISHSLLYSLPFF